MKPAFTFALLALCFVFGAEPARSEEKPRAFDCVRYAENGNELIIDLPGLLHALQNGSDPNWIDRTTKRPFSTLSHFVRLVSFFAKSPEAYALGVQAIKALVAAGAKLQSVDKEILFGPIVKGRQEIVSLLLGLGADAATWPNDEIGTALSPVEEAVKSGYQDVADLLVAHGATKPNEKHAVQLRFLEAARYDGVDSLEGFLKKGANVNYKGPDGETALINALWGDGLIHPCAALAKVTFLLNVGADPNLSGKGITYGSAPPLHQAVEVTGMLAQARKGENPCPGMVLSKLIAEGAHVSSANSAGETPLHLAAKRSDILAAKLLLEAGAKVMPRDSKGQTPLDLAEAGNMIKLLKSHGAKER